MVGAIMTNQKFVTTKNIKKKRVLTSEQKRRMEYIDSHVFSLTVDPLTKQPKITAYDK